ncbi:MAG: alpha/beta hydrolase domain-containing protein, partial [Candidatus Binatia bacterium]
VRGSPRFRKREAAVNDLGRSSGSLSRWSGRGRAVLAAAVLVAGAARGPSALAAVSSPTVSEPPSAGIHGHALWDSWFDLGDFGYVEHEYFVSGTAKRHGSTAAETAQYVTRIIVARPAAASAFNGTVVLDWVNVTAQFENAVDTVAAHAMLLRDGYAFVHVSAQAAGLCCTPLTPKVWDPVRYATLSHPGDEYSFDIFSQVASAIRSPTAGGIDPMAGLVVERVIAAGQSQSASRLSTYVREVAAGAAVIDGFLVHSGGSKVFAANPPAPVLHLLCDAEADPESPNATTNYRLWEIAGSAHSDFWIGYHQEVGQGPRALADAPKQPGEADEELHRVAGNYGEQLHPGQLACLFAGAQFPMRYSVSAALRALDRWIRSGTPPAAGPRYEFDATGQLALDAHGNALGGIRLPPIVHPVATYASTVCALGGITIPFTEVQLRQLYPTHADYYAKMEAATAAAVAGGWMLPDDAPDLLGRACAAKNRWPLGAAADC